MSNETISVPRADLEVICIDFETGAHWAAMLGVQKLCALLAKPAEVTGDDVLRWMDEHAAAQHQGEPSRVAESVASMVTDWVETGIKMGTDWRNGLPGIIQKRIARFDTEHQGEPVAWDIYWTDNGDYYFTLRHERRLHKYASDPEFKVVPLYTRPAEQPAPVAVAPLEVVGRQCFPSEAMKAVQGYRKEPWVDGDVGQVPSEPGFYRIEPLVRLSDVAAPVAVVPEDALRLLAEASGVLQAFSTQNQTARFVEVEIREYLDEIARLNQEAKP